jgi:hypothetical protein
VTAKVRCPDDLSRQLDALELLLRQFVAMHDVRLQRMIAGMVEANGILAKRLERAEDLILALDQRLTAVETMREERNALH